jgi:hypothetical protein
MKKMAKSPAIDILRNGDPRNEEVAQFGQRERRPGAHETLRKKSPRRSSGAPAPAAQ